MAETDRILAQISRWCGRACQGHICDVLGEGAEGTAMMVHRPLLGSGKSGAGLCVLVALDISIVRPPLS